jgi:hypothetical protein
MNAYELLLTEFLIAAIETEEQGPSDDMLLKLCSRTLRDLFFNNAKRPEGVKDALIAFGYLLMKKQFVNESKRVLDIARRTDDPLSGLL